MTLFLLILDGGCCGCSGDIVVEVAIIDAVIIEAKIV